MHCPACHGPLTRLCDFPFRDFDGSIFSFVGALQECGTCGLGRVVTPFDDAAIGHYYANDCLYAEASGVGVGGRSPEDMARYALYEEIIGAHLPDLPSRARVVDVGCSRGGFLAHLKQRHPALDVAGIDLDTASLAQLGAHGIDHHVGDALSLPLEDGSADILTYFHVFEHILDLDRVLTEAARALKPGGLLVAETPDATGYGAPETRVGTLFWAAMKEHVYHFTPDALARACRRHGLRMLRVHLSRLPMRAGTSYPSMIIVACKGAGSDTAIPERQSGLFGRYVTDEMARYRKLEERMLGFAAGRPSLILWGLGLEFLNLWAQSAASLARHNVRLVDSNPAKIGRRIDGIACEAPAAVPRDGGVVCCSYISGPAIGTAARTLGWAEDAIFFLT